MSTDNDGGIVHFQVEYFLRNSGDGAGTIIVAMGDVAQGLMVLRTRILARRARA